VATACIYNCDNMATRKRPRKVELEVASTHKVHLTPLYSHSEKSSSSGCCITLSLPISLGRRNLAEWWWEYCPNACDAAKKESVPCPKYCFPVRRKSHREALSQHMIDIDANGKVRIVGRHPQLIHWKGNLDAGDCCRLGIGKTDETLWMLFTLQLVRAVTPPQHNWLQASERKRRLGIFERAFPLNDDSPGKRQLFSGLSTPEDASQEHSVQTKRRNDPKSSSHEATVVRHDLKDAPTSQDVVSNPVQREDEMHSSAHVASSAVLKSGLATERLVPMAASRNVTPHTTIVNYEEARTTASFPLHAAYDISPTLYQSTEEPDGSQPPAPTVRRRLRFDTNGASGRKVATEVQMVRSPSPSLSMPVGLSMEDSQVSIHEATTEPQWRILGGDSQTSPRVRSCLDMNISDWEQVQCNTTAGAVSRAIADLVVAKNKGGDGPKWYPSLLDGCELIIDS
jgi:hypothetical protein